MANFLEERRYFTSEVFYELFPYSIEDPQNGIAETEKRLLAGEGLIIIFNHFSKADGQVIFRFAIDNPVIASKPVIGPIAHHQYESFKFLLKPLSKLNQIVLYPLVIPDTLKHKKYQHLKAGAGQFDYAKAAIPVLEAGGVVLLNPQQGRKPKLEKPISTALSFATLLALRRKVSNFSILPVGINLPGVTDFQEISGFRFGTISQLNIGHPTHVSEIIPPDSNLKDDKFINIIDNWGYEQLLNLTPESYH